MPTSPERRERATAYLAQLANVRRADFARRTPMPYRDPSGAVRWSGGMDYPVETPMDAITRRGRDHRTIGTSHRVTFVPRPSMLRADQSDDMTTWEAAAYRTAPEMPVYGSRCADELSAAQRRLAPAFLREWHAGEAYARTHRAIYPNAYDPAAFGFDVLAPDVEPTGPVSDKVAERQRATAERRAKHLREVCASDRVLLSDAMLAASDVNLWHHESAALEQAANAILSAAGFKITHTDTFDRRSYRMHVIGDPLAMRSTPRKVVTRVRYEHDPDTGVTRTVIGRGKGDPLQRRHDGTRLSAFVGLYAVSDDYEARRHAERKANRATARANGTAKPVGRPTLTAWQCSARTLATKYRNLKVADAARWEGLRADADAIAATLVTVGNGLVTFDDGTALTITDGATVTRYGPNGPVAFGGIHDAARRAALAGAKVYATSPD